MPSPIDSSLSKLSIQRNSNLNIINTLHPPLPPPATAGPTKPHKSLLPVAVVENEVAQQAECRLRLVSRHHVPRVMHQSKPQIASHLGPTHHLAVDRPDLLLAALPLRNTLPVERVQVVEHTRSIHHEIVLSVVNQHSRPAQSADDIASVRTHDVGLEGIVDVVISRNIVNVLRNTQFSATVVEQSCKSRISLTILPEIVCTHSSPELVPGVVIVGDEVEVGSGLDYGKDTFL